MNWNDEQPPAPQPSRLPWMLGVMVILAGALLFYSVWQPPAGFVPTPDMGPRHPAVKAGAKLTRLELQPLIDADENLTLDTLHGKVALVNFWGPWCGPCNIEFPYLMELRDQFADVADFKFVSVSVMSKPGDERKIEESTVAFLQTQGVKLPVYIDENFQSRGQLLQDTGLKPTQFGYPTTLVLDRDGKVRALWIGYAPGWEQEMAHVVKQTLAGQAD